MKWKKSVHLKWTFVILLIVLSCVNSRPQDEPSSETTAPVSSGNVEKITREDVAAMKNQSEKEGNQSRDVKTKNPVIGESFQKVATQLLDMSNKSAETPVLSETRIPPKLKTQLAQKHKIKVRNDDGNEPLENSHAGIAVPVSSKELNSDTTLESSTSNEGISTWVLVSNPVNKDNPVNPTEPTRTEDSPKKQKPNSGKTKNKRPPATKLTSEKRPIIGSTNKSDLVAGGSAITDNVLNKIKDTVLNNVQKNKNASLHRTTTVSSATKTVNESSPKKKDTIVKEATSVAPMLKVSSKPKNKVKTKTKISTKQVTTESDLTLMPVEAKEQEIELEISTPATTTKKPKRRSSTKKNKTKKRKTSSSQESESQATEVKTSNKTKSSKTSKKPNADSTAITSQIYNYFSREVMPSVGVGVIGLAGLVGLASYFFYPFSTPVRRTFEVDKKDDLYRHNAEEYGSEGNGQAEEEMLGTVLAGMPAHAKQKLNPYAGQTVQPSRYPLRKEQDIRYRHVAPNYDPSYSNRYPQQKTGIAHGAVYPESIDYNLKYDTRNMYTTENKYSYDKPVTYPAIEPIYAAPQTGPSDALTYGTDSANSVVYGVKSSDDSDFKPVYPFESQIQSETTNSPATYPPTSMYLGSENDAGEYDLSNLGNNEEIDSKFVVGNVPKELVDNATPAVVPEHGPRQINKRKKRALGVKRNITESFADMLKSAIKNREETFLSNEIDGMLTTTTKNLVSIVTDQNKDTMKLETEAKDIVSQAQKLQPSNLSTLNPDNNEIVESVSTLPLENNNFPTTTTESSTNTELVSTNSLIKSGALINEKGISGSPGTTESQSLNTETTTEFRSETSSTLPSNLPAVTDTKEPDFSTITNKPTSGYYPEVITYPPLNQDGGFFTFLKRLIEFKYRLGLSILQSTSESLNRYLRSLNGTAQRESNSLRQ